MTLTCLIPEASLRRAQSHTEATLTPHLPVTRPSLVPGMEICMPHAMCLAVMIKGLCMCTRLRDRLIGVSCACWLMLAPRLSLTSASIGTTDRSSMYDTLVRQRAMSESFHVAPGSPIKNMATPLRGLTSSAPPVSPILLITDPSLDLSLC